jgi:hypothetical protein
MCPCTKQEHDLLRGSLEGDDRNLYKQCWDNLHNSIGDSHHDHKALHHQNGGSRDSKEPKSNKFQNKMNGKIKFLWWKCRSRSSNPNPRKAGFNWADFNMLRFWHEKSKGRFDNPWPFLFNIVIDSFDLWEVTMVGRQFTWANSLPEPTFEKLDRVLMDANWESKFPMVSVRALERIEGFSDHAPILLTTRTPKPPSKHRFKFELGWLQLTSQRISWDG